MAPEAPTIRAWLLDGFQLIDRIELEKGFCTLVRVPLYLKTIPPDPAINAYDPSCFQATAYKFVVVPVATVVS
jgi:hypothetical protein